jgi:hypothetical protein
MIYDHLKVIEELVSAGDIPLEDTFDYSNHDPYKVVENYFQFCQTNLEIGHKAYDISPAKIYIRRRMDVNAAARKCKKHYVIRVNFGTVLTLFRLFTDHRQIFEKEALSAFALLHKNLDASLDYLLFQISTQFTFYHEKAHLIQTSPVADSWLEETYEYDNPEEEPFSLLRHLYEFDADLYSSTLIGFHLLEYWKKQNADLRTEENLKLIVSIGVAAVLSYFIFLLRNYPKMYYEASTHPHPLIRISYIVDNIVNAIKNNLDKEVIDSAIIMSNAFQLTNELFTALNMDWIKNFNETFILEKEKIKSFIQEILFVNAKNQPELTINRPLFNGE